MTAFSEIEWRRFRALDRRPNRKSIAPLGQGCNYVKEQPVRQADVTNQRRPLTFRGSIPDGKRTAFIKCDKKKRLRLRATLINVNADRQSSALFPNMIVSGIVMRTYYFDLKDGIPVRDRKGLEFSSPGGAIEHSKDVASQLRTTRSERDPQLMVSVLDESGAEIHREPVYPDSQADQTAARLSSPRARR